MSGGGRVTASRADRSPMSDARSWATTSRCHRARLRQSVTFVATGVGELLPVLDSDEPVRLATEAHRGAHERVPDPVGTAGVSWGARAAVTSLPRRG